MSDDIRQSDPAERLIDMLLEEQCGGQLPPDLEQRILHRVNASTMRRRRMRRWTPIAAAAVYLLASWLGNQPPKPKPYQGASVTSPQQTGPLFRASINDVPLNKLKGKPLKAEKIKLFQADRRNDTARTKPFLFAKVNLDLPKMRAPKKSTDGETPIQDGSQSKSVIPERSTNHESP